MVHLSFENVILNNTTETDLSASNLIVLVTKMYIYTQRCLGNKPDFESVKSLIFKYKNIEKYIAILNGNEQKNELKWEV